MSSAESTAAVTELLINQLSQSERYSALLELQSLAEHYHVPGVSRSETQLALESGGNFVAVSDVGGSISALQLGGEDIYFNGRAPFMLPALGYDMSLQLESPDYYRFIAHHVVPVANQFPGFSETVNAEIEHLTGQKLEPGYHSGHHGAGQCRLGELQYNSGAIRYSVNHRPDKWNLFNLHEEMQAGFMGDTFVQEVRLYNPNNFPIPVSLLHHPYFVVPATTFNDGKIDIVSTGKTKRRRELFGLASYATDGEQRFNGIPLLANGQALQFTRGDGVVLEIGFNGDYDQDTAGVQIFSNGHTSEKLQADYLKKHKLHRVRLQSADKLMQALGYAPHYSENDALHEANLHEAMLKGMAAVCIESNTSRGNIYGDENAGAVILQPQQSNTYIYTVRRLA